MREIINILETIEDIAERDKRYKMDAYDFVLQALTQTVSKLNPPRHVSGKELLTEIKRYAKEQFGPLAYTVLTHWGITSTEDFGNIVFNLVQAKVLLKTEQDSIEDFKNGYNLKKALG